MLTCGSCPNMFGGTIDQALAWGWGYWKGQDHGGSDVEHIICRDCRTVGHKRALPKEKTYEDEPLF